MARMAQNARGTRGHGERAGDDVTGQANGTTSTGRAKRVGPSDTAELSDDYKARLSPDQFAWLMRGFGIVSAASDFAPGSLEDYQSHGAGDR